MSVCVFVLLCFCASGNKARQGGFRNNELPKKVQAVRCVRTLCSTRLLAANKGSIEA